MQKEINKVQNKVPGGGYLLLNKYSTFACFKIRHIK